MKTRLVLAGLVAILAFGIPAQSSASPVTINFDDLSGDSVGLPANYSGFSWSSNFYTHSYRGYNAGWNNTVLPARSSSFSTRTA
jgi:hypothetical protein